MRLLPVVALLGVFFACSIPSRGQAGKAELFGTVFDPSGLAVAKAKVTAEEQATSSRFEVSTGEHGDYHLLGLDAGHYALTVEQPGFRLYRQTGITMRIGDQTRLNVKLELGQPSQTVTGVVRHQGRHHAARNRQRFRELSRKPAAD